MNAFFGLDRSSPYDSKDIGRIVINHINGIRWDNRADNLRLVTQRDNIAMHHELTLKDIEGALTQNVIKDICSVAYRESNKKSSSKYITKMFNMLRSSPAWKSKIEDEIKKMDNANEENEEKPDVRGTKVVSLSVSNDVFNKAEKRRIEMKMTRSRFYAEALKKFLGMEDKR